MGRTPAGILGPSSVILGLVPGIHGFRGPWIPAPRLREGKHAGMTSLFGFSATRHPVAAPWKGFTMGTTPPSDRQIS